MMHEDGVARRDVDMAPAVTRSMHADVKKISIVLEKQLPATDEFLFERILPFTFIKFSIYCRRVRFGNLQRLCRGLGECGVERGEKQKKKDFHNHE
jgi:hypothetical protein